MDYKSKSLELDSSILESLCDQCVIKLQAVEAADAWVLNGEEVRAKRAKAFIQLTEAVKKLRELPLGSLKEYLEEVSIKDNFRVKDVDGRKSELTVGDR